MKLTDKQKRFCEEYLVDLNATQAAIRAGYAASTAVAQASRLLATPHVQSCIQELQAKTSAKLEITREMVVAELAKIGFSNIRNYYDENNRLIPFAEMTESSAAAVASVEVDELWGHTPDGRVQLGDTKKLKMHNKLAALDSLCRVLGFNAPEKKEITGELNFLNLLQVSDD